MDGKNQCQNDFSSSQLNNKCSTNKNSNRVFHKQEQRTKGSQDIPEDNEIGQRKAFPTSY